MVLWTAKLERFHIPESTIRTLVDGGGHVYDTLNAARVKFYEREYASAIQNVKDIAGRHEESEDIIAKLCRGVASQDVHDFLLERNTCHCDLGEMECRTLILMDGTHSMHPVLELTKNCIRKMFERTTECIRSQGSLAGGVGMQLCVYRNYNATEDLMLQCSDWASSPDDLLVFLDGVAAGYGHGREAVELGFHHALQQHEKAPLSQIIVIGDAPPNTRDNTDKNRRKYAPFLARFPTGVYYDEQIELVREAGIAVHTFYVATNTSRRWRDGFMAMSCGSESKQLDLQVLDEHVNGNEHLAAAVTTRILDAFGGGGDKSKQLVQTYVDKYGGFGYV